MQMQHEDSLFLHQNSYQDQKTGTVAVARAMFASFSPCAMSDRIHRIQIDAEHALAATPDSQPPGHELNRLEVEGLTRRTPQVFEGVLVQTGPAQFKLRGCSMC